MRPVGPSLSLKTAPTRLIEPARGDRPAGTRFRGRPFLTVSRSRVGPAIAIALGFAFGILWSWLVVADHTTFHDTNRDVGIYTQVLWNTVHGRPYQTTLLINNTSHLAEHVAPLLLLLAPPFLLAPDPTWLIVLQQAALALAGAPVYLLARRRLGGIWPPLLVLASFYLAPALTEVVFQKFHPVAFATLPLGFGTYFILTDRPKLGALLSLSVPLIEETSSLALFGIGLMLLLRRRLRLGILLTSVSAAWLALVTLAIMPAHHLAATLDEVGGNRTLHKFRTVRAEPLQALQSLVSHAPDSARWWLLPNAGLALLAPQTLIAALPTAGVLISNEDPRDLYSHRPAPALPLVWLASVEGLALLGGRPRRVALGLLVAASLFAFRTESRLPGGGLFDPSQLSWSPHAAALQAAVLEAPPESSVAASSDIAGHLATRSDVYVFPAEYSHVLWPPPTRLGWWLLDVSKKGTQQDLLEKPGSPLRASPPYQLWLIGDTLIVAADRVPPPVHPWRAQFGDALRLEALEVAPAGEEVTVRLGWRVTQPLGHDYVRILQLLAPDATVLDTRVGPATLGYYGAGRWPVGQVVVEDVRLRLDPIASLARTRLRVGWRDSKTGAPLSVAGSPYLEVDTPVP